MIKSELCKFFNVTLLLFRFHWMNGIQVQNCQYESNIFVTMNKLILQSFLTHKSHVQLGN